MGKDVRNIVNVAMTRVMHLQGVEPSQQVFLLNINAAVQILISLENIFFYLVLFSVLEGSTSSLQIFTVNNTTNENDNYPKTKKVNSVLKHLIMFFGGLDILLICIYSAIEVFNRRTEERDIEIENGGHLPENHSAYENVDFVSIYLT